MKTDSLYCLQCGAANDAGQMTCFACDKPLTADVDNHQPFFLHERYRLLSQLGTGGFGAVYKVADTHSNDAILALKQINLRGLSAQQVIEATDAFNREVALLSPLKHPNLPHVYEHFTDNEHWYLTMDFIEGDNLEAYIERKCAARPITLTRPLLPLPELLDIALQLCKVLSYLHTRQPAIIFRDLKPANIMLTPLLQLYLIDFGIARLFKPGQARDTIPFGSPGYAAPEQYGKAQTSVRSDIYSLGALLHYLLSGNDPADNPFTFAPLHLIALPGAAQLENLVMSMVSLQAERRPPSIAVVESVLRQIAKFQPDIQPPLQPIFTPAPNAFPGPIFPNMGSVQVPRTQRQSSQVRTTRRTFVAVGAIGAIGLATAAIGGTFVFGRRHIKSSSVQYTTIEAQPPTKDTQVRSAAFASDGAYATIIYNDSVEILSVNKGSTTPYTTIPLTFPPYGYAISPDGSRLCVSDVGGYITIWNVLSQERMAYSYQGQQGISFNYHLAWSPDNRHFAIARSNDDPYLQKTLDICDALQKASVLQSYPGIQKPIQALSWSPNGDYIAALDGEKLYVWNPRKSTNPQLGVCSTDGATAYQRVVWSPDSAAVACFDNVGQIQVWSYRNEKLQQKSLLGTSDALVDLAWSPDGKYFVVASAYQLVLFDAWQGASLDLKVIEQYLIAVYWSKNSQQIIMLNSAGVATPLDVTAEPRFG